MEVLQNGSSVLKRNNLRVMVYTKHFRTTGNNHYKRIYIDESEFDFPVLPGDPYPVSAPFPGEPSAPICASEEGSFRQGHVDAATPSWTGVTITAKPALNLDYDLVIEP